VIDGGMVDCCGVAGVGVEELVGGLASKIYLFCYSPTRGQ
jgi:hypothetical protein